MSKIFPFHPTFRNHSYWKATHEDILDGPWSCKYWAPTPNEVFVLPIELTPITMDMNPKQSFPVSLFDNWVLLPRLQGWNMFPECRTGFIRQVSQENAFKCICWWPGHCIKNFVGKQDTNICRSSVFLASIHLMHGQKTNPCFFNFIFFGDLSLNLNLKHIGHVINQPSFEFGTPDLKQERNTVGLQRKPP